MSEGAGDDLQELYEQAPFGYLSSLPDWTIVKINQTLLQLLGLTRDEVLGRRLPDLLTIADRIYHETYYAPLVVLQGAVKEIAVNLVGADEVRYPVLLNSLVVVDEAGVPRSIRTGVVDMRDRQRYEQQLRVERRRAEASERREQLLQRVLAELAVAVTIADIAEVLGGFVHDVAGADGGVLWLTSPDDRHLERHEAFAEGPPPTETETTIALGEERIETLALRQGRLELASDGGRLVVPLFAGERPLGIFVASLPLGTAVDTDQQALLTTLGHQAGQVIDRAQVYERKDHVLGTVAHDLRTPLTMIGGFALTLRRLWSGDPDPSATLMIDRIVASSERLTRLTDDLLDASAIGAGHVQLQRSPHRFGEIVLESVGSHRYAAEYKGIDLDCIVRTGDALVLLDEGRIVQVIDNLVGNAVKYSPPDTTISVTATASEGRVRFAVSDQGPGVVPSEREHLFRAFGRTSNRPTGGETSTGLGLAIAHRLIQAHGGSIEVETAPGFGSTFAFELPRMRAERAPT